MRETLSNRGGCAKLPFLLGLGFQTPLPGRVALVALVMVHCRCRSSSPQ